MNFYRLNPPSCQLQFNKPVRCLLTRATEHKMMITVFVLCDYSFPDTCGSSTENCSCDSNSLYCDQTDWVPLQLGVTQQSFVGRVCFSFVWTIDYLVGPKCVL